MANTPLIEHYPVHRLHEMAIPGGLASIQMFTMINQLGNTSLNPDMKKRNAREIPRVSRCIPFERLTNTYFSYDTIMTMHQNRVTVVSTREISDWLDDNCQNLFTRNIPEKFSSMQEIMFLSAEDMALFMLKFV